MKTLAIIIAALSISMSPIYAQEHPEDRPGPPHEENEKLSPEERAEKHTNKMIEVLGLSEDQATQVRAINLEHAKKMQEFKEEHKALKARMKKERERTRESIDSVLTDDQKKIVQEKEEKRKQKRKEHCKCCDHK